MRSKIELRQAFRSRLETDGPMGASALAASRLLCARLAELTAKLQTGPAIWAAFQPMGFEPDIRPACALLSQIAWVFPRVEGDRLAFYQPQSERFTLSKWGILEPDPAHSVRVEVGSIRGFWVPALAFDLQCNRLGHGKGFYDRLLAEHPSSLKIGVALDRQVSDETLPTEPFDVSMDWVVTESRSLSRPFVERKTS